MGLKRTGRLRRTDPTRVPVLPPPQPFQLLIVHLPPTTPAAHRWRCCAYGAFSACDDLLDFTLQLLILVYLFGSKLIPFSMSVLFSLGAPRFFHRYRVQALFSFPGSSSLQRSWLFRISSPGGGRSKIAPPASLSGPPLPQASICSIPDGIPLRTSSSDVQSYWDTTKTAVWLCS
ncbi:hypothetical protein FB451DRAFT_1392798 [Mycena latifolia]|nr:hypothetical protein FB451DRAFT_1392798 [Mycena latifolia]